MKKHVNGFLFILLVVSFTHSFCLNNNSFLLGSDNLILTEETISYLNTPPNDNITLFGPKKYLRTTGNPNQFSNTFSLPAGVSSPYIIQILNGDQNGNNRISSGEVKLNGMNILTQSNFNQQVWEISKTINLVSNNTLEVRLTSKPGSYITITVIGTNFNTQLPQVPILLSPVNNSLNTSNNLTVSWNPSQGASSYDLQISDNQQFTNLLKNQTGITNTSFNVTNLAKGVKHYWRVRAVNSSGVSNWSEIWNFTTASLPVLIVAQPVENFLTNQTSVNVVGSVNDNSISVKINGQSVSIAGDKSFSSTINLPQGSSTISVVAKNSVGDSMVVLRHVRRDSTPPQLTISSPANNFITNLASVNVVGTVADLSTVTLKINGNSVTVTNGAFTYPVTLVDGNNSITIIATDAADNSTTETRTVKGDSTPPVLTVTAPTDNFATNLASVNVTGTVSDSSSVSVTVNGNPVTLSTQSFSYQVTLVDGNNNITVVATDAAGNPTSLTRTVIADVTSPTLTVSEPTNNLVTKLASVNVIGSILDSTQVTLTINGNNVPLSAGAFTYPVSLLDGSNTITIIATDAAGNSTTITRNVIRDNRAPTISLSSPPNNLITNLASINVTGTVTDSSSVTVTVNGNAAALNNKSFSYQVALVDGSNIITVIAADAAGNSSTMTRNVKRDIVAPVLTVSEPLNNLVTKLASVVVTGTVTDSSAVTLTVNGNSVAVSNGSFTYPVSLLDGINTITIVATDAAGNATTEIRKVSRDTTTPTLTVSSPTDNLITKLPSVNIVGTVTDSSSVTLTINGNLVPVTNGAFTYSLILVNGPNTITIVSTDAAGNSSTVTRNVIQDIIAPVISITSPGNIPVTNLTSIDIIGSVSDSTNVSLTLNGNPVLLTNGAFNVPVVLVYGINTFTLVATDAASNTSTLIITLDTAPPVITITNPVNNFITNQTQLLLSGSVDKTNCIVTVNNDTLLVSPTLTFSKTVLLSEGINSFLIKAKDEAGNISTLTRTVRLDTQIPVLLVTYPQNNFNTDSSSIHIVGKVSDSTLVTVKINNQNVPLQQNGSFNYSLNLAQGNNNIEIKATDAAGNITTLNRMVFSEPIIIPIDPALIAPKINDAYAKTFYDANSFLWTGANAIQYNVVPGSIEAQRVGVVRGTVIKKNGEPLPGVKVYSPNHPEWGFTFTRADGKYDFGLNAGGFLIVKFERNSYLPATRTFDSPWNKFVVIDTVALTAVDNISTVVNFTQPFKIAQSSTSNDRDGTRKATIFFEQGTVATMILPDNSTQILDSLTARATEYTVGINGPKAMPANLPPSVSYTYCTDLTADEALATKAKSVTFNKPVRLFTENFIGFPIGTSVPTGIWDWESFGWLPRENGAVIKIVSVTNNKADISIKPDGSIANAIKLDSLGITDAERGYIASVFNVGQTIWRTRLTEFGVIDQGYATIQPDNAETPKIQRIERFVNEDKYGSLSPSPGVDVLNQTLHKEIGITGTPFSLTYSSDRVEGRKSQLIIPLTGATIQPSLIKIILKVTVLGVEKESEYSAAPNLSHTFIWDGKDGFGRAAPGRQKADILIGYVHSSNYQEPAGTISSFGSMSGVSIPGLYSRETTTLWQCAQEVVGEVDNRAATLGGWNLNIHNGFDQVTNTLYLGSGQNKINDKLGYVVETIGGNGQYGVGSNNVQATATRIADPTKLAVGPDGSVFFIERDAYRIRKINPSGIISTVAGNGQVGSAGDGGPATLAQLYLPVNIAVDKDGNLYILQDEYQSRIRKVDANGIITTLIGGNGFSGDGGPASAAKIWRPSAIAFAPDGSIYFADQNWVSSIPATPKYSPTRIRKIDPDGIITTVAGGVETLVANPQSVPATQVRIEFVNDLQFGPDGDLYILSGQNFGFENPLRNLIMKLGKDGRLHKITYGGYGGVSFQEGTTAKYVYTDGAQSISFDRNCSLCYSIANPSNQGLRLGIITPDYINNILSGNTTSQQPSSKSGTPARIASLNFPIGMKTGPDGSIYFTEELGNLIRKLTIVAAGKSQDEYSVNSNSGKEIFYFNNNGKHIRTEDALTGKKLFTFSYDAKGKLVSIKDVDSLVTTIERDTSGTPTAIISPRGERTELAVNIDGYLSSVSNPNNEAVGLGYMTGGLLSQFTDPKNNSSLFGYDAQGRLISKQIPDEGAVTYSKLKTADGYTVTETKPLGERVVHRIYNQLTNDITREVTNAQGISIDVKDLTTFVDSLFLPDGSKSITETGFDPRFGAEVPLASKTTTKTPAGLTNIQQQSRTITAMDGTAVKSMTEDVTVNYKLFRTEYTNKVDGINNYVKSTSAENRISQKFYDQKGRLIKEIIPGAGDVEYLYLQEKLTRKVHYPQNGGAERTEYYFYDSKDRLISSTDPLWQADSMHYDAAGRLTRYVFKDGRSARFIYDAKGNLTSIIPPGKTAHVFEFDKADKKTGYIPPATEMDSLSAIRYVYDQDGKLLRTVYPDASSVQMIYDTDNCNCTSSSRVKSIAYNNGIITYNYNSQSGQVMSVIKSTGDTLSYTYDGSLPKTETWKGSVNGNVSLAYNNDFRVTEQKINNANAVAFAYDKDGLMTQAGAQKMKYNSAGQLVVDTLGNITGAYTYTGFGELKTYTAKKNASTIFSTDYTRDDLGRITQISETVDGSSKTLNYTYDTAGRLIEAKKDGNTTAKYVYDTNGNRLAKVVDADNTKGIFDEQDRLLQYGNEHYRYNKNGYLTTKYSGLDTTKYTYDNLGNLLLAQLTDGTNIEYVVDANNRRIAKKVNGSVTKRWLYSGELTPIAELDSLNNVTARFVYGTKSNTPDYIVKGDTTYKIITDHLGSLRLVINLNNGQVAKRIDYDEYGNVLSNSGNVTIPFGYAGGLTDAQTGLVRFGARDYSATTGRWNAKDPIGFNGGDYNLYGYVLTDPINKNDNQGLSSGRIQLMLIGASISFAQGLINHETPLELIKSVGIGAATGFFGGIATKEKASVIMGAVVGAISNGISQLRNGTKLEDLKIGSMVSSGIVGAIGAGFSSSFIADNFKERAVFAIGTALADYFSTIKFAEFYTSGDNK